MSAYSRTAYPTPAPTPVPTQAPTQGMYMHVCTATHAPICCSAAAAAAAAATTAPLVGSRFPAQGPFPLLVFPKKHMPSPYTPRPLSLGVRTKLVGKGRMVNGTLGPGAGAADCQHTYHT